MIPFSSVDNCIIDTSTYSHLLHDEVVDTFGEQVASYVGAKYFCCLNSATSAIFLIFLNKKITVSVPSIIPPVVLNALITSGNSILFEDNISWVGSSYILHDFGDFRVIDSAQSLERDQFRLEANPNDLMIFSHYPTKPVGSCDGGVVVSDDYDKIQELRELSLNGMSFSPHNWERKLKFPGYKMYMNSVQADIALRNLGTLESRYEKLDRIRSIYNDRLNLRNSSRHLYRISVNNNSQFLEWMKNNGVMCGIHYPAQHLHPVFANGQDCPLSTMESRTTASLPFHHHLTDEDLSVIIDKVNEYQNLAAPY